jgi:hypothetical protein
VFVLSQFGGSGKKETFSRSSQHIQPQIAAMIKAEKWKGLPEAPSVQKKIPFRF